ncbi:MAG: DNA primase [Gammaproteobacteria bacterium]|nr:DNA primase [Gammaproteobacteria bacterium]
MKSASQSNLNYHKLITQSFVASHIDRTFIDTLLARTDIVELINSRVTLKKKGNNYLACCPFHGEKTPSFNVSASKQFYHCFGCGVNGNAINFLREYEHLEFIDAVEELAERAGLEVPKTIINQQQNLAKKHSLFQLMEFANDFYQIKLDEQLKNQQSELSQYINQRGLSAEIIKTFAIGYSPNNWDSINTLLSQHKATQQDKLDTGLVIHNEDKNKVYDRFRHRLMFPIRDRRGKTIGFGGRIINSDDKQAKYINSPETPLFHKGGELYGLYELNQSVRNIEKVLVVEGYMDVVSLAQHGVPYAVATLGTATSEQHIEKLFRLTKEIIFCFDGDRAGKDAAWKAMSTTLPIIQPDKNIKFIFLEQGEDPDSIIRKVHKSGFEARLENAMPLSEFLFSSLQEQVDFEHADGRSQFIDLAKGYLQKIPVNSSFYVLMKDKLAKMTGINLQEISKLIDQQQTANSTQAVQQTNIQVRRVAKQPLLSPVFKAISYLLNFPDLAKRVIYPDNYWFQYHASQANKLEGLQLFIRLLDLFQYDPTLTTARLISIWDNNSEKEQLQKLIIMPLLIQDKAAITQEFDEILKIILHTKRKIRIEQLQFIQNTQGLGQHESEEYKYLIHSH